MVPIAAASSLKIVPAVLLHGVTETMSLAQKVFHLARNSFILLQGWCLGGYGAKEVAVDGFWERHKVRKSEKQHAPFQDPVHEQSYQQMQTLRNRNAKFAIGHGALFATTGIFGILSGLNKLDLIDLGKAMAPIEGISTGLFILANIVGLEHNIRVFQHANKIPQNASPALKETARKLKISAISGMISNIGYILTGAAFIFGAPMALALVFGCIGLATGCFKIIYDFFFLDIEKQLKKVEAETMKKN